VVAPYPVGASGEEQVHRHGLDSKGHAIQKIGLTYLLIALIFQEFMVILLEFALILQGISERN
jgi:hypothetical protein